MSNKIFLSVEWFNQAEISSYGMTSDQYNGQSVSNKSLLRPTLFSHSPGKGGCSHVEEVGMLVRRSRRPIWDMFKLYFTPKRYICTKPTNKSYNSDLNDDKDIVNECFHLSNKQILKHCHEQHNSFSSLDYKSCKKINYNET